MKLEEARIINLRELNRIIASAEIDGEYGAAKALKRFKESFKEVGPELTHAFNCGWDAQYIEQKPNHALQDFYKNLEL